MSFLDERKRLEEEVENSKENLYINLFVAAIYFLIYLGMQSWGSLYFGIPMWFVIVIFVVIDLVLVINALRFRKARRALCDKTRGWP